MRTLHGRSIADFRYSPLAAALAVALAPQVAQATSIVVNNTSDSSLYDPVGATTLRGALDFVNANCTGADTITFTSNGPFVTSAATDLPAVTCSGLTIDGGGSMAAPGAFIFNGNSGGGSFGLQSTASTPVNVKGMGISGWTYGTGLAGHLKADNNSIHNNSTGIDSEYADNSITNNAVYSNSTGIFVAYGGQAITGNHIYSNSGDGLDLILMTSGSISNNIIGINALAFAGNGTGIYAYGNKITIDSNTLGANSQAFYLDTDLGSTISSNRIGIDSTGTAFGNDMGMYIYSSTGTTFSGNILSNTYGGAVEIEYGANITLSNNKFGTNASGTQMMGNYDGIEVDCSSNVSMQGNVIVNWYGGTGISFNGVTGGGSLDIVNNKINVAGDGITSLGGMSYGVILRDASCGGPPLVLSAAVKSANAGARRARHVRSKSLKAAAPTGATTNVMISGNSIRYVDSDSILVSGGFNSTITGNTLMYGGEYGVNVAFGSGIKIVDDVIYGHDGGKNVSLVPGPVYHNTSGVLQPTVPNDGQDAPVITSVARNYTNNSTVVAFSFNGPAGSYLVEVCQNDPISTVPGCSAVVGSKTVTISSGTSVSDSIAVPGTLADYFSANVTSVANSESSEFSTVVAVTPMPAATYVPTALNFGNVGVNIPSSPMTVTITSTGATPYVVSALASPSCNGVALCYGGPFSCTTTCTPGTSYNPGQTCRITATFLPTVTGAATATIGICDNVYGGTITLSGTGVPAAPVTVSPSSWDFGQQLLRTQGPSETFTITNPTTAAVSVGTPVTSSTDFVVTDNNCPGSIAPNGTCHVDVAFNPQSKGLITGTLLVLSGGETTALQVKRSNHGHGGKAAASPEGPSAQATLQGTGIVTPGLTLPDALDLGAYTSGDPANTRTLTLTNTGNAVLTISSVTATGPFTVTSACPENLNPDATCNITVSYSATDLGVHTGNLLVVSNADPGAHNTALTATTIGSATPLITVSPAAIGFGDRLLGTQSAPQRITITNIGNAPAVLASFVTTTDFLVATSNCTSVLAPATSCFADVELRPVGFGPRIGAFEVDSNAQGSPFTVKLSGSGCRPYSASSSRLGTSFRCAP